VAKVKVNVKKATCKVNTYSRWRRRSIILGGEIRQRRKYRKSRHLLCQRRRGMVVGGRQPCYERIIVINRSRSRSRRGPGTTSTTLWKRWRCYKRVVVRRRGPGTMSTMLRKRRQCRKLLCQMGRKMGIDRSRRWRWRLEHLLHADVMWSPMTNRAVKHPFIALILLSSRPSTSGGVRRSEIP
jgi:hypothetical protein